MSWSDVSDALDHALSLPRKPRSNAIDHAQLRLLYRIAQLKNVGRAELEQRDQADMNVVNKRLIYLQNHQLINVDKRYWGDAPRWRYALSAEGQILTRTLARGRSNLEMVHACNTVQQLLGNRQLNASHLKTLVYMAAGDAVRVPDLIEHTGDHRATVRSRLKTLTTWGLITRDEEFNAGGNQQYCHWRLSSEGRAVITTLFPEGFVVLRAKNKSCTALTSHAHA